MMYAVLLFSVCRYLFGTWLPPSAEKGLWLYASLAHLLLGTLLLTHFTKPVDAVSDAIIAALVLPEIHHAILELNERWATSAWNGIFAYYLAVIVSGSLAMVLRGPSRQQRLTGRFFYIVSTRLGETSVVFSVLYLFAVLAFHRHSAKEVIALVATWLVIVPLRLLENAALLAREVRELWGHPVRHESLGETYARKEPNLILIRKDGAGLLSFGQVLAVKHSTKEPPSFAMTIDELQLADERWIRCLQIGGTLPIDVERKVSDVAKKITVFKLDHLATQAGIDFAFGQCRAYSSRRDMIGLVACNTDIRTLRFEVTRNDLEIGEGQLVAVAIGKKLVLYQVINGLTEEEILAQKNTYGFARGSAKKIGAWDNTRGRFEHTRWIPRLNEPVFLERERAAPDDPRAVGFFPDTAYPITLDIQQLVTHNAAILGILGAGKSFLALS